MECSDEPVSKGLFLGIITASEGEETRIKQVDKAVCSPWGAEGRDGAYGPGGAGGPCTAPQMDGQEAARGCQPGQALAFCLASALPPVHAKGDKEAKEEEAEHYSCSHHAGNQGSICGDTRQSRQRVVGSLGPRRRQDGGCGMGTLETRIPLGCTHHAGKPPCPFHVETSPHRSPFC